MMGQNSANFQKGDVRVCLSGRLYHLRLTMSALAQMEVQLGVSGPLALAKKLREWAAQSNENAQALALFQCCVLEPGEAAHPSEIKPADSPNSKPAQNMPALYMSALAALFEQAFI